MSVETTLRILEMPKDISSPIVSFHFQVPFRLLKRKQIRDQLIRLAAREKTHFESLTYIFCSDEYLLNINQQYLRHDFYTDIITFNLSSDKYSAVIGEIYISIDRVRDNATNLDVPVQNELLRVIFHGALHLCGFKDKSAKEKAIMRKAEDKYLALFEKCST